jgi:hypothetical protein
MIPLGPEICGNLAAATQREWLETNGLGGFASSTIIGFNTRRWRDELDAMSAQARSGPLDVRHHQGKVLEPGVVAARVGRDIAPPWGHELRQFDLIGSQGETDQPAACSKHAYEAVIPWVGELDVKPWFELQHVQIEGKSAVHIAHGGAD